MEKASAGKSVSRKITIESIAEQWMRLVLAQVQAKKLPHKDKELIKIKTKYV